MCFVPYLGNPTGLPLSSVPQNTESSTTHTAYRWAAEKGEKDVHNMPKNLSWSYMAVVLHVKLMLTMPPERAQK